MLHTLVTRQMSTVQHCVEDARRVMTGVGKIVSSRMVEQAWELKHRAAEVSREISGSAKAIEDLQKDGGRPTLSCHDGGRPTLSCHASWSGSGIWGRGGLVTLSAAGDLFTSHDIRDSVGHGILWRRLTH